MYSNCLKTDGALCGRLRWSGNWPHYEIFQLSERLFQLDATGSLTAKESVRTAQLVMALECRGGDFWPEFEALRGQPLPDPGIRPLAESIWPYHSKRPRDFNACLGFVHRIREWLERVEVKYGLRSEAAS